eukprot:952155_1
MHEQIGDIAALKAAISELKESYQERQQQMESKDLSDSIWHQRITEQYVAHTKKLDVLSRVHRATHGSILSHIHLYTQKNMDRMYQPRLEQQFTVCTSQDTNITSQSTDDTTVITPNPKPANTLQHQSYTTHDNEVSGVEPCNISSGLRLDTSRNQEELFEDDTIHNGESWTDDPIHTTTTSMVDAHQTIARDDKVILYDNQTVSNDATSSGISKHKDDTNAKDTKALISGHDEPLCDDVEDITHSETTKNASSTHDESFASQPPGNTTILEDTNGTTTDIYCGLYSCLLPHNNATINNDDKPPPVSHVAVETKNNEDKQLAPSNNTYARKRVRKRGKKRKKHNDSSNQHMHHEKPPRIMLKKNDSHRCDDGMSYKDAHRTKKPNHPHTKQQGSVHASHQTNTWTNQQPEPIHMHQYYADDDGYDDDKSNKHPRTRSECKPAHYVTLNSQPNHSLDARNGQ